MTAAHPIPARSRKQGDALAANGAPAVPSIGEARSLLSIGKLTPGQHDYYLDTVTRCAEEYYRSRARPKPLDGGRRPGSAPRARSVHLTCRRDRRPRA
jgi:hypothetical protein